MPHDLDAITAETLRRRGCTQTFIAGEARVPIHRLQRALAGNGIQWLNTDEQHRLLSVLVRLGILPGAGA